MLDDIAELCEDCEKICFVQVEWRIGNEGVDVTMFGGDVGAIDLITTSCESGLQVVGSEGHIPAPPIVDVPEHRLNQVADQGVASFFVDLRCVANRSEDAGRCSGWWKLPEDLRSAFTFGDLLLVGLGSRDVVRLGVALSW